MSAGFLRLLGVSKAQWNHLTRPSLVSRQVCGMWNCCVALSLGASKAILAAVGRGKEQKGTESFSSYKGGCGQEKAVTWISLDGQGSSGGWCGLHAGCVCMLTGARRDQGALVSVLMPYTSHYGACLSLPLLHTSSSFLVVPFYSDVLQKHAYAHTCTLTHRCKWLWNYISMWEKACITVLSLNCLISHNDLLKVKFRISIKFWIVCIYSIF